jgi:hypothetical protein
MTKVAKTVALPNDITLMVGTPGTPLINISTPAHNFGNVALGDYQVLNYTVNAQFLIDALVITAPGPDWIINLDNSAVNASPITLNHVAGSISNTNIYCRYAPTLPGAVGPDNIAHTSTGAVTKNLAVQGAGTMQADLQAWHNGLTGAKLSASKLQAYNRFYTTIDAELAKMDLFHLMLSLETDEQILQAVKTSSGDAATPVDSPTLDGNGITGNGVDSYVDLEWSPGIDGVQFTRNSACAFEYVRSNTKGVGAAGSKAAAESHCHIQYWNASDEVVYSLNSSPGAAPSVVATGSSKGFWCRVRTAPALLGVYKDMDLLDTDTAVSAPRSSLNELIGAVNTDTGAQDFDTRTICLYGRGNSTVNQHVIFKALQTLCAELGIVL